LVPVTLSSHPRLLASGFLTLAISVYSVNQRTRGESGGSGHINSGFAEAAGPVFSSSFLPAAPIGFPVNNTPTSITPAIPRNNRQESTRLPLFAELASVIDRLSMFICIPRSHARLFEPNHRHTEMISP
jgi:hypothetical protein